MGGACTGEGTKDWRGIVFVEQTITAVVVEQLLCLIPELEFFRSQCLTGVVVFGPSASAVGRCPFLAHFSRLMVNETDGLAFMTTRPHVLV